MCFSTLKAQVTSIRESRLEMSYKSTVYSTVWENLARIGSMRSSWQLCSTVHFLKCRIITKLNNILSCNLILKMGKSKIWSKEIVWWDALEQALLHYVELKLALISEELNLRVLRRKIENQEKRLWTLTEIHKTGPKI